eukprot:5756959-Amphidinium_carterae.2
MASMIVWDKTKPLEDFLNLCQDWGAELRHCNLCQQSVQKSDIDIFTVFKLAVNNICTVIGLQIESENPSLEGLTQLLNTATQACRVVANTGLEDHVDMLQGGVGLLKCFTECQLSEQANVDIDLLQKCGALGRLLLQVKQKDEKMKGKDLCYVQALRGLMSKADLEVEKLSKSMRERSKEDVAKAIYELQPISGGQAAGKNWLDDETLEMSEWDPFMAHAKKTLLRMDAQLLENLLCTCNKAK